MAADKLSKRSKVSNDIPHASWEIQKVKKKKYSRFDSNTKSHISLEWDDKKEHVVSKKEQISIAQRELAPFLPYGANYQNVLGDVFEAPLELFELSDLTGLLSYEVWQTHLSVQEREFLTQFLPEGADPHKAVHELFTGNNLYFGNLFPKWGASICSGDYHPDVILRQEQHNKANKVAYYSELHEYHTKMIGSLQSWKERWTTSMNPDNFMQKTPRPKREFHKSGPSHETGLQHDLCATSGSSSWDADNKSCNSDNGETLMRTDMPNKYYNSSSGRSVTRPKKGDKLRKLKIEFGDGAKYMSYIKVSKEQHERVKSSMKQSNTSVQSRSLNNVLGNLDGFCVKPFEMFEEEERQKLHSYWLNLVKKDLPAGFENWKSWRSAKWQVIESLRKEMEEKWESKDGLGQLSESLRNEMEEKCESKDGPTLDLYDNNQDDEFLVDGQDEELEQSSEEQHADGQTSDALLIELEENMEQNTITLFQPEPDINTENHETANPSSQDSDQHQTFCDVITESDTFPSSLPDYPEIIDHANASVSVEQFPPPSAASEIWPLAPLPNVYYHQPTPVTQDYSSVTQSSYILRRTDGGDSFFNPYVNQDRNELLSHSLYKDQNSHYLGPTQYPRNLTSSLPLDPRSNIQQNIYTDGVGHLLPLDTVSGWPGINLPMSVPPHHWVSQTWFSDNEVARDGWSGGVVPDHVDESLYSVLSECSGLRSGVSYGPTEMIQSGSFADIGREPVPPIAANVVPPQAARGPGTGFNYMSGNGNGQLGWMNLSRTLPRLWNDKNLG
ncbi:uncharacterized protein LOC143548722 [Bidens hawaiensis]|uniref:uncharacterized protein LOC143548722 n=1 Tax=Bidens hawaiensis TaxID=980011 RepID=UPI004048FCDE